MDENKPKNIFEAAGKTKKNVPSKSAPPKPLPKKMETPQPENISVSSEKLLNLHRDPEINEMLNKIYNMQDDIQTKLNEIYEKNAISPRQVKKYLNNPRNFPPDVWQKIQLQRDTLERKIGDILQSYVKPQKKGHLTGMPSGTSKERRIKTLGSRKKWIPM